MTSNVQARILNRSEIDHLGCWIWQGYTNHEGYGQIRVSERSRAAHRVAYEAWQGEIAEGLEIDHLCRVRNCVNPEHLEAVPPLVNKMRSESIQAINARKTHCVHGHEFTEANTILLPLENGRQRRKCRTCGRAASRALDARKRAAKQAATPERTHCGKGLHPLVPENLIHVRKPNQEGFYVRCRPCTNEYMRGFRSRRKQANTIEQVSA